jgi:Ca-activated chloride channel family protein
VELLVPTGGRAAEPIGRSKTDPPLSARVLGPERYAALVGEQLTGPAARRAAEFLGHSVLRSDPVTLPARSIRDLSVRYNLPLGRSGGRIDYVLPRSWMLSNDVPLQLQADVHLPGPLAGVYSPTHAIQTVRLDSDRMLVRLDPEATRTPGPFRLAVLPVDPKRPEIASALYAWRDQRGDGYFLLVLAAGPEKEPAGKAGNAQAPPGRREVTIAIDRSGSTVSGGLDLSIRIALDILSRLGPADRFNIIDYANTASCLAQAPLANTERNRDRARTYLRSLQSKGGTNLHAALLRAVSAPASDAAVRLVLLLTDGLPSQGVTDEDRIVADLAKANPHARRRIFPVAIGDEVNAALLGRLARQSRGQAIFLTRQADLQARNLPRRLAPFYRQLRIPRVRDLTLRGGENTHSILPDHPIDLRADTPAVVAGRFRGDGPLTFILTGQVAGRSRSFSLGFPVSPAGADCGFVPRIWARRRMAELLGQIWAAGAIKPGKFRLASETETIPPATARQIEEIIDLSLRFGSITEYTRFLVGRRINLAAREAIADRVGDNLVTGLQQGRIGKEGSSHVYNEDRLRRQQTLNPRNRYVDEYFQPVEPGGIQAVNDLALFRFGSVWVDSRAVASGTLAPTGMVLRGSKAHRELLDALAARGRQGAAAVDGDVLIQDSAGRNWLLVDRPESPAMEQLNDAVRMNKQLEISY